MGKLARIRSARHSQHPVIPGRNSGPIHTIVPTGLISSQGRRGPEGFLVVGLQAVPEIMVGHHDAKPDLLRPRLRHPDAECPEQRSERFNVDVTKDGHDATVDRASRPAASPGSTRSIDQSAASPGGIVAASPLPSAMYPFFSSWLRCSTLGRA